MTSHDVVWHDLECGVYTEDLPLWRSLAQDEIGPVLDAGAGTGRVALELARMGTNVVAIDSDPELLAELRKRAGSLPIQTIVTDARSFELPGRSFGLILAPMQLLQLLGGHKGRMGFLRAARAHLQPGGLVACAITESMEAFDGDSPLPAPDVTTADGVLYSSQPVALRDEGGRFAIRRIREIIAADGRRARTSDVIHLDSVSADTLEVEARGAGLAPDRRRTILPTADHVGSAVVMLRG